MIDTLCNNQRRTHGVTIPWVRRNQETLLDWARCTLWATPRAALWALMIYGGLAWFTAALEEERAADAAQANQEEAMRTWRADVNAKRRAAVAALRDREDARRCER